MYTHLSALVKSCFVGLVDFRGCVALVFVRSAHPLDTRNSVSKKLGCLAVEPVSIRRKTCQKAHWICRFTGAVFDGKKMTE